MELGKTSDDTFESGHLTKLEHPPTLQGNPREGTLAIISDIERESLVGRPIEDDLRNENGQIVVSSRMVAERFGKRHDNVVRAIEEKISTNSKLRTLKYFIESSYKDAKGESRKEYLMTRDGFTFIVMGFTGKEALQFKLAYIEAFNKMQEALKNQAPALPTTYKDALIALVAEVEAKEQLPKDVRVCG